MKTSCPKAQMPKLKNDTKQPEIIEFVSRASKSGTKRTPISPPFISQDSKRQNTTMSKEETEGQSGLNPINMDVEQGDNPNDDIANPPAESTNGVGAGNPVPTLKEGEPEPAQGLLPTNLNSGTLTLEEKVDAILVCIESSHRTINQKLNGFQTSLDNTLSNTLASNAEVLKLTLNNAKLTNRCMKMERENKNLRNRVSSLEDKFLANNIIMTGITEDDYERPWERQNWIYRAMAYTVDAPTYEDRLQTAKKATIISTRRLGPYNENKNRPISVMFDKRSDVEYLLRNKSFLPRGVYVDREYSKDTEEKRRVLRPILKAARNMPMFQKKCKMVGDHLVLKGKRYDVDNLDELPEEINGFEVTSKQERNTLGFYGELNPFSNFHRSPFNLNGIDFHSSEQFIQYTKATHHKDSALATKILQCETALECKQLGKTIDTSSDNPYWEDCAKEKCKPGIVAKFQQNRPLLNTLLGTRDKRLMECSYDQLWGTGIPLHYDNWLKSVTDTGILGEILMEIRNESFIHSSNSEDVTTTL